MKRSSACGVLLLILILGGGWLCPAGNKKAAEEYSVVGGTVFRDPGFAIRGAEVSLQPDPETAEQRAVKVKPMKVLSDARGEFAFRVPPVAMRYKVAVACKGFQGQEKTVSIQGGERSDATFLLQPESK
jgi:hypothetical protein